ncbi:MAG: hypothetical protein P9L97_05775 [Candidatus Tenebribacter davisii]|nr:hypothetical protein [Candidatus Tenebribacter davisii]
MWPFKEKSNKWFERYKKLHYKHQEALETLKRCRKRMDEGGYHLIALKTCLKEKTILQEKYNELRISFELIMGQLPDVKIIDGERTIIIKGAEDDQENNDFHP